MRFNELSITHESTAKVIRHAMSLNPARKITKVSGKSIQAYCAVYPDRCCFENMSMFGDGECYTFSDLKALGVKTLLVRCNNDVDLVSIKIL